MAPTTAPAPNNITTTRTIDFTPLTDTTTIGHYTTMSMFQATTHGSESWDEFRATTFTSHQSQGTLSSNIHNGGQPQQSRSTGNLLLGATLSRPSFGSTSSLSRNHPRPTAGSQRNATWGAPSKSKSPKRQRHHSPINTTIRVREGGGGVGLFPQLLMSSSKKSPLDGSRHERLEQQRHSAGGARMGKIDSSGKFRPGSMSSSK